LVETARLVEQLGYDGLFIFDHPAEHPDPWVLLSGLATVTERVTLGSVVNCIYYRHPAYLARMAADLDNLSGGRLMLGLGNGWLESEFRALGAPFRPIPERQAGLEEALTIIEGVWGPVPFSFAGTQFQTEAMQVLPPPLQQPRPPIMIGGSGERRALRQVARLADACNISEPAPDTGIAPAEALAYLQRKLDALRRHCAEVGRPEDEVLRTHHILSLVMAPTEAERAAKLTRITAMRPASPGLRNRGPAARLSASSAELVDYFRARVAIGFQYFVIQVDASDHETLTLLATEVTPHVG
jgi:alkanesulfonate monooxygenase SsuD/methylene tetrahydromethanopterin reductase-like flavin-dependent oxidoreductase (luciferase family)